MNIIVSVALSNTKMSELTYTVDLSQYNQLLIGSQVVIEVSNQLKIGTVIKKQQEDPTDFKLKPILLIYKLQPLNEFQLNFAKQLKQHTCASVLQLQTLFLSKVSDKKIDINFIDDDKIIGTYRKNKELRKNMYDKHCELKVVVDDYRPTGMKAYVRAIEDFDQELTVKQKQAYDYISEYQRVKVADVIADLGISRGVLLALVKKAAIVQFELTSQFETMFSLSWQRDSKLTAIQKYTSDTISECEKPSLLYGVTSSGKTEVYIDLIKKCLNTEENSQCLILVPTVMLAVQVIGRIQQTFDNVIIYHQKLSASEKNSFQIQIGNGSKRIVIGTLASLFLPYDNLKLVIFDEAHSSTYHLRKGINISSQYLVDALSQNDIKVVLGSATPSVTDYALSQSGKYQYVELTYRYGDTNPANIRFIMPSKEVISDELRAQINRNKLREKPTLIYFNRNGYASQVICDDCYHVFNCPHCDKSLTYIRKTNSLECKYDGYKEHYRGKCCKCNSTNLSFLGIGIEQFLQKLRSEYRELSIVEIDGKLNEDELHNRLQDFAEGKYDIVVGTRVISAGIDFLNVDNIYIVNIDNVLSLNEVNAHENVYQTIQQVVGRIGRHQKYSDAIIETRYPKHFIMKAVENHDYKGFVNEELQLRKKGGFTPYYHLCKIEFMASNPKKLYNVVSKYRNLIVSSGYNVSEICVPYIEKRYDKYRIYIIIKYRKENIKQVIVKYQQLLVENNIEQLVDLDNQEIGV